jgi:hypothetical protein
MSQRRIEGLSSASTDVGPSTTALLPPRTTPLAHRAASATLNSKDLRDDQYPPAKGSFRPSTRLPSQGHERVAQTARGAAGVV